MPPGPRPLIAAALTIVGGAFITVGGILLWVVGTVLAHLFGLASPWFVAGVVVGLLTMALGAALLAVPRGHRLLGAAILACAIASIPLAFGGLVLGFALAVVGGTVAIARPPRPTVIVTTASPAGPAPPWT